MKIVIPWVQNVVQKTFKKKILYRRLPILGWLPNYNKKDVIIGDIIAGITVGLMMVPQGLACANIAGLAPQYGLYGAFAGSFVYIIFGSCKDISMGPTVIVSLLTYQATNGKAPEYAILLCFLSGIIQLLMGIFNLGFLVDFISGPVSSGFTSAMALIVTAYQAKDILGLKLPGTTFVEVCYNIFSHITDINVWDTVMGLTSIAILVLMKVFSSRKSNSKTLPVAETKSKPTNKIQKVFGHVLGMLFNCRNALIVVLCSVIAYWSLKFYEDSPFTLVKDVPSGLPAFSLPPFGFGNGNETTTFPEMVSSYGSGILVVPLLSLLEDISTCKSFANGKSVDATQEMIAVGLCNVVNSFVHGHPGSGAMARSAVNRRSGVRTQMASLYTALLVIIALLFFTSSFYYIPKCCLAAIVIAAIIFMVDVKAIVPMWKTKKSDFWVGLATFIACLVIPLAAGIMVGVVIHLLFILYYASRPEIYIETQMTPCGKKYLLVTPDRFLVFPSAEYVRNLVTKHSVSQGIPVIIDCLHIHDSDYTTATAIRTLISSFSTRNQPLFFLNIKPNVLSMFKATSSDEFVILNCKNDIASVL
ncbi:sodium-independent sulfate anion transporter [Agrilus planipennis]|uniref:Sodium-independent sulfate anion transporter n=1 Tax=Agrilus planipennis TaxID=224129 RepID=A0A7F5R4H2_AGRPL|nr:sodium-independent sulfate anion transporter [Agrilus planipennis]XP_025830763.1 sodium-independent sulfate anion transporter [Agrilus planipennis]